MADTQAQGGQQQQPMMAQSQVTMMAPQQSQPTIMIVQMQGESCRNSSRVVAWIDIIIGVINIVCNLIVLAVCLIIIRDVTAHNREESSKRYTIPNYNPDTRVIPIIVFPIAFLAVVALIVSGVELWIATGLLTASDITTPQFLAIEKAKCWRCYHIFLIIFSCLNGGVNMGGIDDRRYYIGGYHFVCFVIHLLFIYIVHSFIQELHRGGGGAPMMMAGGNTMAYTTGQYQQHPSQYQQYPSQNQYQQYPSQYQQQPQNQYLQQPPQYQQQPQNQYQQQQQ